MQGFEALAGIPMGLLLLISMGVALVAVLVALDARERGMSKPAAICWFFAVQLFLPIVVIYMILRRNGLPLKNIQQPPEPVHCPYCDAELEAGARVCQSCRRLL